MHGMAAPLELPDDELRGTRSHSFATHRSEQNGDRKPGVRGLLQHSKGPSARSCGSFDHLATARLMQDKAFDLVDGFAPGCILQRLHGVAVTGLPPAADAVGAEIDVLAMV